MRRINRLLMIMIELPLNMASIAKPCLVIRWRGWETSLSDLIKQNWGVRLTYNRLAKRYRIQLRNPANRLIGTLKIPQDKWEAAIADKKALQVELKDMYIEKKRHVSPLMKFADYEMSKEDIPQLLEIINSLLKDDRQKMVDNYELTEAEIIDFQEYVSRTA